jgi:hypothetical protein
MVKGNAREKPGVARVLYYGNGLTLRRVFDDSFFQTVAWKWWCL